MSDALEAFFACAVFGGYEGGAAWGGAWLEHEGGLSICAYIYGVRYGAYMSVAYVVLCARACFLRTLLYMEVLHGVWAWGAKGI